MNPKKPLPFAALCEFHDTFAQTHTHSEPVTQLMSRYVAAGNAINGAPTADCDAKAEMHAVFEAFPGALRAFGNHMLRLAAIAENIQKEIKS